jgi:hypothetical protein
MTESDRSSEIVDGILRGLVPEVEERLFIFDLVNHAREYQLEAEMLRQLGLGRVVPCIRRSDDAFAPIALSTFSSIFAPLLFGDPYISKNYWNIRIQESAEREGIAFLSIDDAYDNLRAGMIKFLTSRMRSIFDDEPPIQRVRIPLRLPQVSLFGTNVRRFFNTSGFTVTVTAQTAGLRIHHSPTFRRKWTFFGTPTSPVTNVLPGGIYEFGGDGGAYTAIVPDNGTFDIPYITTTPSLLI